MHLDVTGTKGMLNNYYIIQAEIYKRMTYKIIIGIFHIFIDIPSIQKIGNAAPRMK